MEADENVNPSRWWRNVLSIGGLDRVALAQYFQGKTKWRKVAFSEVRPELAGGH